VIVIKDKSPAIVLIPVAANPKVSRTQITVSNIAW